VTSAVVDANPRGAGDGAAWHCQLSSAGSVREGSALGSLPKFRLEAPNGRIAPMAVVLGRLAVARMQTFVQVWWWLLRCLLRVDLCQSGSGPKCAEMVWP
jgi:hypothetical protein